MSLQSVRDVFAAHHLDMPIYPDESPQAFGEFLPAASSIHSAARITRAQLAAVTNGQRVAFCRL